MTSALVRTAVSAVCITSLAGCGASAATPRNSTGATPTTGPALATCGQLTPSTGVLRDVLQVHLSGPTTLPTGSDFDATVTASMRPSAHQRAASLTTGAPVPLVIARGNAIVGQYAGAVAGVGLSATITPAHPFSVPASVSLRGCPHRPVDLTDPDRSRKPLPPGHYTLYAYVDDLSGNDSAKYGSLRSEPFQITVTEQGTQPAGSVRRPPQTAPHSDLGQETPGTRPPGPKV